MTLQSTKNQFIEGVEEIDCLILEKLNPLNLALLTVEEIQHYKTVCHPLKETVKNALFKEVLYQSQERGIESFIHLFQAHLVYLSDTITSYQWQIMPKVDDTILNEYQSLLEVASSSSVVGIISHINCQFSKYFNGNGKVPLAILEKTKSLFFQELNEIKRHSRNLRKSKLLAVAINPLEEFLVFDQNLEEDDPKKVITFRKINYLKILMKEVRCVLKSKDSTEETLKDTLIYINFNTYFFFQYITCEIDQMVLREKDHYARRYKLLWYQKKIKQIEEKQGISLKPERRPIKEQLSGWISEELALLGSYIEGGEIIIPVKVPEDFKLESRLPVEQLSYFLHICMEVGVIANKNRKNVMRFFSLNTQSLLKENISAKSLRNKSYSPEQRTRTAVKNIVIYMLNLINQQG